MLRRHFASAPAFRVARSGGGCGGGCYWGASAALMRSSRRFVGNQNQTQDELKDDMAGSRVFFASASSSELVPHVAAAEAFDTAHAALQSVNAPPPNFAFAVVTVDHEGMIDAPQHLHRAFAHIEQEYEQHPFFQQRGGGSGGGVKSNRLLLGSVVRNQRVGSDGFIELVLGHIPDLRVTHFTLDQVPEKLGDDKSMLQHPVALGLALSDWRLGAMHGLELNERLAATSALVARHNAQVAKKLGQPAATVAPIVGAVLPPSESAAVAERREKELREQGGGGDEQQQPQPSLYFVNEQLFRGSAGVVLLHSAMIQAHVTSLMPSIPVLNPRAGGGAASATAQVTDASFDDATGHWHIRSIDGVTACDFVREAYEGDPGLKERVASKLFVGVSVSASAAPFPLLFVGCPDEGGHIIVPVPLFLRAAVKAAAAAGAAPMTISLLRDDDVAEEQAIAADLVRFERSQFLQPKEKGGAFRSAKERITVHREKRVDVPLANACCMHFSHPLLYKVAKHSDAAEAGLFTISGKSIEKHAPSIARRILGSAVPNSGMYVSGTVLPGGAGGAEQTTPLIQSRSSCHVILAEKAQQL